MAASLALESLDRATKKQQLQQAKDEAANPALDSTLNLMEAANAPLWDAPGKIDPRLAKAPETFRKTIIAPVLGEGTNSYFNTLGQWARTRFGNTAGGRMAGAAEAVGDTAAGLTAPVNLLAAGAGGKAAGLYFAAEGAKNVPEAVTQLRTAETPEQQGAAVVNLGMSGLMAAGGAAGALHLEPVANLELRKAGKETPSTPAVPPKVFSEFGGDRAAEPVIETTIAPAPAEDIAVQTPGLEVSREGREGSEGRTGAETIPPSSASRPSRDTLSPEEQAASEARVAKTVERLRQRRERADTGASPDLIDVVQDELGAPMSLRSARTLQEDFQHTGPLKELFSKDGRYGVDDARQIAEAAGHRFESDEAFLSALQDASAARKGAKDAATREAELLAEQERAQIEQEKQWPSEDELPTAEQRRAISERLDALKLDDQPAPMQSLAREPWQMTRLEWERARAAIRPETFGSSPGKASISAEQSRMSELQRLIYGVPDEAIARMREAGAGKITLSPDELESVQDRIDTPVRHRDVVEKAIQEGKPVPESVLAEYATPGVEQFLDTLKIDTNGKLHAFGLIPEVWNVLIDTVKLGVSAGKTIAQAIDHAIAHIKEKFPEQKLDEEQARPFLTQRFTEPQRAYGEKVLASDRVPPAVQERVGEYNYVPRSNESDLQTAQRIIAERGPDHALASYMDEGNALPAAVRSILGDALLEEMATQQQIAEKSGDRAASEALITKQVALIDHELKRSTEIAQGMQAMRKYGLMSPAGMVRHAKRTIAEAGQKVFETVRPTVDDIRRELAAGHREALEQIAQDAHVNGAARAAVDETVRGSDETHRAVVMEITGAWATSPHIVNTLRAQLQGKLATLIQRHAGSAADVKVRMETMMRDTMDRVLSIANSHYQLAATPGTGADFGRTLAEKIADRTGLSKRHSEEISGKLDKAFAALVKEAEGKLSKRIAAQRARQLAGLIGGETSPVDKAIRKQLQQLNQRLGDVVRAGTDAVAGQTIAERIVTEAGLKGEAADQLRAAIESRFRQMATEAKRRRLEAMAKDVTVPRKLREGFAQMIEASNLGAFESEAAYNMARARLGLPAWTPELAGEITRRANEIRTKPEGFQKQRAVIDLLNHIERTKGLRWHDLPMGFWYANVLSGVTTHAKNVISTTLNTAAHVGMNIAANPAATPAIVSALGRGVVKGASEAADILRTGVTTGTRLQSLAASKALELKQFDGWAKPLNAWKYVFRAMAAEDMLLFKPAEEMKSVLAARIVAKREGLRGKALDQRVNDIIGNVEARRSAAQSQAHGEGLTGLDFRRRTAEIIEQSRPDAIRESARDYALRVTFNAKPYGLLGAIAEGMNMARSKFTVLNTVVPFVNIVANVTNEGLNYLPPVGLGRAVYGHWTKTLEGKPLTDRALLHEQYAKALLGTAAIAGVAALAAKHEDDADPRFAVNGAGPTTPEQRKQLQGTGWIPYSFKIGGRFYSFANTPLAIPMAALGNYMDARKYRHLDASSALNRAAVALAGSGKVITEQSFLNGVADVFKLMDRQPGKETDTAAARWASRVAIAGAVPNAVRQLDQLFDPSVRDANSVESILINSVPFVRRLNHPAINALGDPVQRHVTDTFTSPQHDDPLLQLLADKQAWPSMPARDVIVGDRKRGPDHFRMLDEDEFYDYVQTSGARIRQRLEAALPRLETLEPTAAKAYVQKVAEQERHHALRRFSPVQ